jgi:hypothetical protein
MPFCRICGAELDKSARFCRLCGNAVLESADQSAQEVPAKPFVVPAEELSPFASLDPISRIRVSDWFIQYVLLPALLLAVLSVKLSIALQYHVPIWDSYVYLSNARGFLLGRGPYDPHHFFELLRPPLFPLTIAQVWLGTGVNYDAAAIIQPIFTAAAAYVFFLLMKRLFGVKPALVGSLFLLSAPVVFLWTNQILVHGEDLFFLITAVYLLWRGINGEAKYLPFSGGALALATLTRYTILVMVPVFVIMLAWLFVASRRNMVRYPWREVFSMILVFVLVWAPWLLWNYRYVGDPFASLFTGFSAGALVGGQEVWYFYIVNVPTLLGAVGSVLLLVGLLDKSIFKDKGKLFLLAWIVIFFLAHTIIQNKDTRFYLEWAPPLVGFAALGVSRIEARMPSKTKILGWAMIALWLFATFYPAVNASLNDARTDEFAVGSYDEFIAVGTWINANTAHTDIGATDFAPALSFQTDRLFYDMYYIQTTAGARGLSIDQFMTQLGVNLIVLRPIHDPNLIQTLGKDSNFALVKQFQTWVIFRFSCSNCTRLP